MNKGDEVDGENAVVAGQAKQYTALRAMLDMLQDLDKRHKLRYRSGIEARLRQLQRLIRDADGAAEIDDYLVRASAHGAVGGGSRTVRMSQIIERAGGALVRKNGKRWMRSSTFNKWGTAQRVEEKGELKTWGYVLSLSARGLEEPEWAREKIVQALEEAALDNSPARPDKGRWSGYHWSAEKQVSFLLLLFFAEIMLLMLCVFVFCFVLLFPSHTFQLQRRAHRARVPALLQLQHQRPQNQHATERHREPGPAAESQ